MYIYFETPIIKVHYVHSLQMNQVSLAGHNLLIGILITSIWNGQLQNLTEALPSLVMWSRRKRKGHTSGTRQKILLVQLLQRQSLIWKREKNMNSESLLSTRPVLANLAILHNLLLPNLESVSGFTLFILTQPCLLTIHNYHILSFW